jgi:hypothetical protein
MATPEQNEIYIQQLTQRLDSIDSKKKTAPQLAVAASPVNILVTENNIIKTYPFASANNPPPTIEAFEATSGQTVYTVSKNAIVDNGLWTVQVEAELWNSRTGITAFDDGQISINFATGLITFHVALDLDTNVIIKYY